jgi:hypothetical protein
MYNQQLVSELQPAKNCVRFQVLTAVTMKNVVFWVAMPYTLELAQHFIGAYHPHLLQSKNMETSRSKQKVEPAASFSWFLAWFTLQTLRCK